MHLILHIILSTAWYASTGHPYWLVQARDSFCGGRVMVDDQ